MSIPQGLFFYVLYAKKNVKKKKLIKLKLAEDAVMFDLVGIVICSRMEPKVLLNGVAGGY